MLRIDCLLLNTEVTKTVKQIIGYLGHKGIVEDKDVSFRTMYNELRKNGVEIDLETAAHIYANELPLHDARFTSREDLEYDSGHWFDKIVRNITLQEPKKGEKQIGELSPSQAVTKGLADAFHSNVISDQTTRSILSTLEDVYKKAAKRMLGELPNKDVNVDKRSAAEIVQQALDNEATGYRNIADGIINGLKKMHDEVRKELAKLTEHMEAIGDQDKVEQWNNYAKSLEDASYTMLFTSKEAKTILQKSLSDAGFIKTNKDGKELTDWQKLAGNINSYEQLRKNTIESLTASGIKEEVANRVADSMTKEFRDIRGKILETAIQKQERIKDTWDDAQTKVKETIPEIVDKRVKDWQNFTKFEGKENEPLKFSKLEAQKIIGDALKNHDQYGMDFGPEGQRAIDWKNMAQDPPEQTALRDMVASRLIEEGVKDADAQYAAQAIARDYHKTLTEKIAENSKRLLDTKQANLDRESPTRKSELTRLAELHDLGVFDGAHDKLLAHVLGIEEGDRILMDQVKEFATQMSNLKHLMNGNDFLVPSMQREIAHQIQQIVAKIIENKTYGLKAMSFLNKIFQVENSSLVSGHRNLLENHLSGLIEFATTKAQLRLKLGKDLTEYKQSLRQLMGDTWKTIAQGGNEFGLAPYQVGGTQLRVTDVYNLNKMKGADWSNPKVWIKGVASGVMTIPRAFLSGTDGAFKTALYRLHFMSGMRDALVKGGYTHEEAIAHINDAIYGEGQLEKARVKAEGLYKKSGIKYISKKEINITANELLHENLLQGYIVTPEMIKEVQGSAFKMAGLGMGHEANNPMSNWIQSSKIYFQRKESEAFAAGRYSKAAKQRMWNTIVNSVALRFAASQANWAWIKIEQSGVGIISGIVHYQLGEAIKGGDLLKTENLIEQTEHYQKARQSMARGVLGLAANAILSTVVIPSLASVLHPDENDPVQTLFDEMGDNYLAKALFLKLTPLWGLAQYFYHKDDADILSTATDLNASVTGFGDKHSSAIQFAEASKNIHSKNKKIKERGYAQLGSALANNLPHVPFYKTGKDVLQTVNYFRTGTQPLYKYPDGFTQGLWAGGAVEDIAPYLPDAINPWAEEGHEW